MVILSEEAIRILKSRLERALSEEERNVSIISKSLLEKRPRGYSMFADETTNRGFYSWYIDHDMVACKQYFYLASRLRVESCKYSGGWDMNTPHSFIFALLSDSSTIINTYKTLDTINVWHKDLPSFKDARLQPAKHDYRFLVHYLQSIIQQDWVSVEEIKSTAEQKIKKLAEVAIWWFKFGDALQQGNKASMLEVINTLLTPRIHKAWNKDNVYELNGEVWSHHPVMFTKLAWMQGYELEIDNPLVPMELMPVKPLPYYDEVYDFLKAEGNSSTIKAKGFLSRWFKR